jgi:hypothetical protein
VSRSACSSTPALWARSNNETEWGNRPLRKNSNRRFARLCLTRRVVDVYRPRKRHLTFLVGGLASLERNLLIWFHNLDYANRQADSARICPTTFRAADSAELSITRRVALVRQWRGRNRR